MVRMSETWNVREEDERGHFIDDDGSTYWEEGGIIIKRWPYKPTEQNLIEEDTDERLAAIADEMRLFWEIDKQIREEEEQKSRKALMARIDAIWEGK
jgi:hypothetical protein